MQPLLTVITPTLNVEQTIKDTLESVKALEDFTYEHLVIDGGSSDGTLKILSDYDVHLIQQGAEKGLSAALNMGLKQASGKYVAVLNGDDFFLPAIDAVLERISRCESPSRVVCCDVMQRDLNLNIDIYCPASLRPLGRYMSIYHPAMFVPNKVYSSVGPYDQDFKLAMDSEWVHRARAQGVEFETLKVTTAIMRLDGRSHTNHVAALYEFFKSSLKHGQCSIWEACFYLVRQTTLHTILKANSIKALWLKKRNLKVRHGAEHGS